MLFLSHILLHFCAILFELLFLHLNFHCSIQTIFLLSIFILSFLLPLSFYHPIFLSNIITSLVFPVKLATSRKRQQKFTKDYVLTTNSDLTELQQSNNNTNVNRNNTTFK